MDAQTVVTVVSIIGAVVFTTYKIGKPIIELTNSLTKNNILTEENNQLWKDMNAMLTQSNKDNDCEHEKINDRLNKHEVAIKAHEITIEHIEKQIDKDRRL